MSIRVGDNIIAGGGMPINKSALYLFDFKWSDHLVNQQEWLRADTFTWHDGTVYQTAYQHLVDDIGEPQTYYAWGKYSGVTNVRVFTTTLNPQVGDTAWAFSFDSTRTSFDINNAEVVTIINSGTGTPPIVYIDNGNFYAIGRNAVAPTELSRMSSDDITLFTNLNSETISGTTIQYYLAADGHKIVDSSQEANVGQIFLDTGVAWYYILDQTNTRFKLPRTEHGVVGVRGNVGDYVEAGLPDIYGNVGINDGQPDNVLFKLNGYQGTWPYGGSASNRPKIQFKASDYNSIYGNSTTVQPPATEMYLYFYVGEFTQTATQNTAGLNAELFNSKADLSSVAHVVVEFQAPTANNNYTWYRKYADGWVEQGGISNTGSGTSGTITLPITMQDNNYTAIAGNGNNAANNYFTISRSKVTTTTIKWYKSSSNMYGYWEVKGMAA